MYSNFEVCLKLPLNVRKAKRDGVHLQHVATFAFNIFFHQAVISGQKKKKKRVPIRTDKGWYWFVY